MNRRERHRRTAWLISDNAQGLPKDWKKFMKLLRRRDWKPKLKFRHSITFHAPVVKQLAQFWEHDPSEHLRAAPIRGVDG